MIQKYNRLHITIRGAVQGVGFRPFIYRLATELNLTGWVNNSSQGVYIEVEGNATVLETFLLRIETEKPPAAFIQSLESTFLDVIGYKKFEIRPSVDGEKTAIVLPDISTCSECLTEIFDKNNPRYNYPFTNCTNCGPRFTIIEALPYDRCNTTMKAFPMCPQCQAEYENPLDRRFHAEPIACPICGPHLELWDKTGQILATHHEALNATVTAICQGKILAIKGLGGFHLMVDARNEEAVKTLRKCKQREEKPFAVMYPCLELIKQDCFISEKEERLLRSPEAPIVLLQRRPNQISKLAPSLAPGNPYLGVMLPYTPLHHLLTQKLGFPIIATSGNLSDEPICIDENDALKRLNHIAELFLIHNRPIKRPVDDSIVRIIADREMVLRRARSYAPLPIFTTISKQKTPVIHSIPSPKILAVGAHLKNTIAIAIENQIFLSQHIGDLETNQAFNSFQQTIKNFQELYDFQPSIIACDAHPDYRSSQFARDLNLSIIPVQHHYAHILACMGENQIKPPLLGIAWDGTGYGLDNTIWGGEFILIKPDYSWQRVAHWRTFPLPGGEKAVKEPRRVAIGLLSEIFGDDLFNNKNPELFSLQAFSPRELGVLKTMLAKKINTPITSSVGRLFDAIASIINLRQITNFEGQSAMELEFALEAIATDESYTFNILNNNIQPSHTLPNNFSFPLVLDWQPLIMQILDDISKKVPVAIISGKFHNSLIESIISIANIIGEKRVIITGGCFQNKYLTEKTITRLRSANLHPYWHQRIPPNDGSIALGQIIAANNTIPKH